MPNDCKAIFLILDGLGDRSCDQLGGRTPLESASTPTLDRLAAQGITGLLDPLAPGIRVSTDVGCLALFGYNPLKTYWGRGPIEAAGVDLKLKRGDVALRANFSTINEEGIIVDRRAGRIREGTEELAKALDGLKLGKGVKSKFRAGTEHRGVLVLCGDNLSAEISDSDPGVNREGEPIHEVKPKEGTDSAKNTAKRLNKFLKQASEILADHPVNLRRMEQDLPPANAVITRGAGMGLQIPSVTDRFNINAACVACETTVLGVAKLAGFATFTGAGMTANLDTDLKVKAKLILKALEDYQLVICHIKGTDIAGHDGDARKKADFIGRIDDMLEELLENYDCEKTYIAVSADHSTPCRIREHTADPVPTLIWGYDILPDKVTAFHERACYQGGLSRITANGLLLTIMDYLGATYRFGS